VNGGAALAPWIDARSLPRAQDVARGACEVLRLPLGRHRWRGQTGPWTGVGRGGSVEFQDHRPYVPGDDPRHVDWPAWARTGQLALRLYREEVSPAVDVIVDVSRSMRADPAKRTRTLELLLFCVAAAEEAASPVRVWSLLGEMHRPLHADEVCQGLLPATADTVSERQPPRLDEVPLRPGSLRVLLTDALFAGAPAALLRPLAARHGCALVLAPFTRAEAAPEWTGSLEMVDCESLDVRPVRLDARRLRRYGDAWRRHFEIWGEEARRHGVAFAQVPAEGGLVDALHPAVLAGALEAAP
jgi:uncharacterized protein (DUF58 family)